MKTKHEVIYGGLGSGKSTYAFSILNPKETFKLGNGTFLSDLLTLKIGSVKRHREDNIRAGVKFKDTTLDSVIEDISQIEHPVLLLDEWGSFFLNSLLWRREKIVAQANGILDAVERNPNLKRGIYIALDYTPYLPFNLYKKKALWNKVLFERADEITRIDYGKPMYNWRR